MNRVRVILMSKNIREWWIYPLFHKSIKKGAFSIGPVLIYFYKP